MTSLYNSSIPTYWYTSQAMMPATGVVGTRYVVGNPQTYVRPLTIYWWQPGTGTNPGSFVKDAQTIDFVGSYQRPDVWQGTGEQSTAIQLTKLQQQLTTLQTTQTAIAADVDAIRVKQGA